MNRSRIQKVAFEGITETNAVYAADFIKRPFIGRRKNLGEFRTRRGKLQAHADAERVEKLIFMSPLRSFFLAGAAKRKSNLSSESAKVPGAGERNPGNFYFNF